MANSTLDKAQEANPDAAIWLNLRAAIAKSSGFKRWQQEKGISHEGNLDLMVRRYLEETLETLAY